MFHGCDYDMVGHNLKSVNSKITNNSTQLIATEFEATELQDN